MVDGGPIPAERLPRAVHLHVSAAPTTIARARTLVVSHFPILDVIAAQIGLTAVTLFTLGAVKSRFTTK